MYWVWLIQAPFVHRNIALSAGIIPWEILVTAEALDFTHGLNTAEKVWLGRDKPVHEGDYVELSAHNTRTPVSIIIPIIIVNLSCLEPYYCK